MGSVCLGFGFGWGTGVCGVYLSVALVGVLDLFVVPCGLVLVYCTLCLGVWLARFCCFVVAFELAV